jgi:hypothetical protein
MFAGLVSAQTVVNPPVAVQFDHAGFATAASYDVGYFFIPVTPATHTCNLAGTPEATPRFTDNVAPPQTTTGIGMTVNLVTKPIGCYVLKVREQDTSGLTSPWSVVTAQIGEKDPPAPVNATIK